MIYHGLIVAVEERIAPFATLILNNLIQAMTMNFQYTDSECMRYACGLVSDMASWLPESIAPRFEELIPLIRQILQTGEVDISVKLTAIIAVGDVCMVTESSSILPHLQNVMGSLNDAAVLSLKLGDDEEDKKTFS